MSYVKTTMIDKLLSVISPHRCCSCDEIGAILCESCKINILDEPFLGCVVCRRPCGQKGVCGTCVRRLPCEQAWCVGERSGALKALLDTYKFSSSRAAAGDIVTLLDKSIPVVSSDTVVVGIPTSPSTRRVRGFDHVGLIVKGFSHKRGLRSEKLLLRTSSATFHFLSRVERMKLGSTLFRLSDGPAPERVLLIDDIVTTGTTLTSAVKLLKAAGVKHVYVAVVARQPES